MLSILSAAAQSAAVRVIPRAGLRALTFVLVAAVTVVCALVATPPAQASGTYRMNPDCFNSGTWAGLIKPWARASRQSPDFGCFATPLDVLEAQCSFLVTNGNASDCALLSPPPPVTENTPPGNGHNLAHGGTQGTVYWDVLVNFFGLCTPPAVQTEGLTCSCPPNTAQSRAGDRCVPISVVPEAQAEPCDCAGKPGRGNPIYPLRGTKREQIELGLAIGGLPLTLTYDSSSLVPRVPAALNDFGGAPIMQPLLGRAEWSASFVRRLVPEGLVRDGEPVTINAVRGDGTVTPFDGAKGHYTARAGGVQRLDKTQGTGYYVLEDPRASSREFYALDGTLQRIEWADGRRVSFGYSDATTPASIAPGPGYLITLTDQLGRQLRIAHGDEVPNPYDPGWNLPKRITLPDGGLLRLQYNNQRSVSGITWPDGRSRTFLYENDSFPWALTGIADERNVRYATFGYDSTGLAISSTHVGGVDSTTVHYGTPPAIVLSDEPLDDDGTRRVMRWQPPQDVVVTGPNGTSETWSTTSLNGHNFLSSRMQAAGSGSAAGASSQTFDAMGNLASADDIDGRRTCYVSDPVSGLQSARVEGLTQQACDSVTPANASLPSGARKTSTQWHANWPLPQRRAEPELITTSVYHGQPDPFNGNAIASCAPSTAQLLDGRPIAGLCKQVEQATTDADGHLGFGAGLQAGVAARITTWTYNALGQVLKAQGPRPQDATSYAYHTETNDDHRAGDLSSITDAKGKVTHFDRYDQLGQLLQSTDPNGVVTVFTYDARQRLLSRTVGAETTSYTYDAIGQLTRVTQPDGTWVGFEYDDAHRRIAAQDSDGNRIDYALDNAGKRVGETVRDPAGILARNSAWLLDALGRVQLETIPAAYQAPGGEAAWTTVASEGESFSATGTWTVRYGANGRWLTRTVTGTVPCTFDYFGGDPAPGTVKSCQRFDAWSGLPANSPALVTRYEYDGEGHVTRQVQAPDGLNLQTQLGYDALARPAQVTDPKGGTTSLAYDGADRTTQVTDPRSLATRYARNGFGETTQLNSPDTGSANQTYDDAGNLKTRLDSRGVLESYTYDELNRLTGASFSQSGQPSQTLGWSWDLTGGGVANSIGRLSRSDHPNGSARFQYDPQGRVTQATQTVSPITGANAAAVTTTVQYGYTQGRLASITYPSGRQLSIQYTGRRIGALALAQAANSTATTLLGGIQWEPFGPVRRWQWGMLGTVPTASTTSDRYYDQGGRLQRYRMGDLYRDLSYDAAGRMVGFTHWSASDGSAQAPLDQAFGYDENSRLTLIATATSTWNIGYDANGNRTGVTLNGDPSTYTTESTSNRLTAISNPARSFGYDNAGNTTSDSPNYTAIHGLRGPMIRLTKAGVTAHYTYDAERRRVRKFTSAGAGSTIIFVYDLEGQLLGEYDQSGQALREYVWLEHTPVAMFTPNPALADPASGAPLVYFIHTDHLKAPRIVVDRSNVVRWRWIAEPFGTTAAETNPSGAGVFTQNLRFPGQYADQESGLFYNYHRYYNKEGGQYTQSDPVGLAGGSVSTYAYVGGSPLLHVDPVGLARKSVVLREGYTGGLDVIPNSPSQFEIHVFDPLGEEIGLFGPSGWFNKHGHKGRPLSCPIPVENQLKGQAIDMMRRSGELPPKGQMNIKGDRWMRSVRGIGPVATMIHFTTFPGCMEGNTAMCMCEVQNDMMGGNPYACSNPCEDPESEQCI